MQLDTDNITIIPEQRVFQLAQAQLSIAITVTFVEHHLLAVMRPTFRVGSGEGKFADFRRIVADPQELNEMSGIYLMDGSAWNHAVVKCLHPFFCTLRIPFGVRRGYVEKRLPVAGFVGSRCIH